MCAKANGRPVQAAVYVGLKIAKKFDAICPVQPISLGGGVTGYHLRDLDAWIDGLKLVPPDKRSAGSGWRAYHRPTHHGRSHASGTTFVFTKHLAAINDLRQARPESAVLMMKAVEDRL
jgi:hypothetical protein